MSGKEGPLDNILKTFLLITLIVLLIVGCAKQEEQSTAQEISNQARLPIIDMHMHTFQWNRYGDPPPPNSVSGIVPAARTNREAMEAYLADMERYNIVLAVGTVEALDLLKPWTAASSNRILGGLLFPEHIIPGKEASVVEWPDLASLRAEFKSENLAVMGEITAQYGGIAAKDPRLEPYFALAEELDIPVCIHCNLGPPAAPYGSEPGLRAALGNPLLLEDVLVSHPSLRIYIAHSGYPFLAETKAIMLLYPNVYADISVLNWVIPREEFYDYLQSLMRCGLGKRLMYGSDQMIWPDAVGISIESIESADFLTEEQKRDIFYNNAARFLWLEK